MDEAGQQAEDNLQGQKRSRTQEETLGQKNKRVKKDQEHKATVKGSSSQQLAFRPRTVRIAAKEAVQIHKSEQNIKQSTKKEQIPQKSSLNQNEDVEQKRENITSSSRNEQADVEMNIDDETKIKQNNTDNFQKLQIKQTNEDLVDIDMGNTNDKEQQQLKTQKNIDSNDKQSKNQQQTQQKDKKPQSQVFQYGNYPNYYNMRRNTDSFLDPRVVQFRQDWFKGKSVLDVGCHQGRIGLQIARLFSISKYVGVDIDPVLIAKAVGSLNHFRRVIRDKLKNAIIEKKKEEQRLGIILEQTQEKKQQENNQQQGENLSQVEADQKLMQQNNKNQFGEVQGGNLQNNDGQKTKIGNFGGEEKFMEKEAQKRDEKNDEDDNNKMEVETSEKNVVKSNKQQDDFSSEKNQEQILDSNQQLEKNNKNGGQQENQNDENVVNQKSLEDPVNSTEIQILKNAVRGLDNFKFVNQDFMNFEVAENEKFDVILCLSVMKWIHFHHGDAGVKNLFNYLGEIIKQNGILLLEYQELSTYRTDIKKCRGYLKYDKMDQFKFTPDQFVPFLLTEVGFEQVEIMQIQTENKNNFQRKVQVLRKK
eukprot:TRINITY_DN8252_c1_g1_i1.p1 TRINITY_DN8252_c1_g1~~TRINITY_DN8252_c1_g1_i1.p1  ORF type:complete len:589 (-),score=131.48 TRINITY_DN8252_c1_g1_i1:90-1856(-)